MDKKKMCAKKLYMLMRQLFNDTNDQKTKKKSTCSYSFIKSKII